MYYVYRIQSLSYPNQIYTGFTTNITQRLIGHNQKQCRYTSCFTPWKLVFYVAFEEKKKALQFEKYLKTGSGRAFAKRHFQRKTHQSLDKN